MNLCLGIRSGPCLLPGRTGSRNLGGGRLTNLYNERPQWLWWMRTRSWMQPWPQPTRWNM